MNPGRPEQSDEERGDLPLDDAHAHLLLEYDERVVALSRVIEAIEGVTAAVLDIRTLRDGPRGTKAVLVSIDTPDIRPVVLRLSGYPLLRVEGYNARLGGAPQR
jgi:hypothetical protein